MYRYLLSSLLLVACFAAPSRAEEANRPDEGEARRVPPAWIDRSPESLPVEGERIFVDLPPGTIHETEKGVACDRFRRTIRFAAPEARAIAAEQKALYVRLWGHIDEEGIFSVERARAVTRGDIATWLERLGSSDWDRREEATRQLIWAGVHAEEMLRPLLQSRDAEVRYRARYVLNAPVRTVRKALNELGRSSRRGMDLAESPAYQTVLSLGSQAVRALLEVLTREIERENVRTIRRRRVDLILDLLAELGDASIGDDVIALLERPAASNPRWRGKLGNLLYRIRDDGTDLQLISLLESGGIHGRRNAATALGYFKSEEATVALVEATKSSEPELRLRAVESLTRQRSRKAIDAFLRLATDPNARVRSRAIRGLGHFRVAKAAPILIEHLDDPERHVRLNAIEALGRIASPEAVEPLIEQLGETEDRSIRQAAVTALGDMRAARAVPHLIGLLEKADLRLKMMLLPALGQIGTPEVLPILFKEAKKGDRNNRQSAVKALGEIHTEKVARFLTERFGKESHPRVRRGILYSLDRIGHPVCRKAIAELLREAADKDAKERLDSNLLPAALEIAGTLKMTEVLPSLFKILKRETRSSITFALVETLGRIGDERSVPVLKELLKHADPRLRHDTAIALARLGVRDGMKEAIKTSRARVARDPNRPWARNNLGIDYLYAGDFDEARKQFERMLEDDPENEIALYNMACAYSLEGKTDPALDYLERAVEAGFEDPVHMERDTDLDNIRTTERFKSIMERIEPALLK